MGGHYANAGGHGHGGGNSRRVGFHSAVDLEGLASSTVSARVEALGTGPYQLLVVACVGVVFLSASLEMGAVAPLHSALARVFGLSDSERASLPAFTYAGSMAGLAIAGPVSDKWGRKVPVILSLLLIGVVMLVTATAPPHTPPAMLLTLRFLSGLAEIGGPAGLSLAAESCSGAARSKVVFAVMFLGSVGYLVEGIAVQTFMPDFGESDSDNYRGFCLLIAAPAILSLPLVLALRESPRFLAVQGDAEGCVQVLDAIAWWNGRPSELHQTIRVPHQRASSSHAGLLDCFQGGLLLSLASTFSQLRHAWMLTLLLLIDSSRMFFTCGSSYLWKDLFSLHDEASVVSASALNTIASVAPLLGLFLGDLIVRTFGVRRTCALASTLAAVGMLLLTSEGLREVPGMLLFMVMTVKLTYGPLATCVSLLKLEAFPTEVRASTFALVSMIGKLLALVAPTAAEVLRGGPSAEDWTKPNLLGYMGCLVGACVLTGAFVLLVDRGTEEHAPLEDTDHLGEHRAVDVCMSPLGSPLEKASRCSSGYGSIFDIWAPGSPGPPSSSRSSGKFDIWLPRLPDSPSSSPSSRWRGLDLPQSPKLLDPSPSGGGVTPRIIHS